MQCGLVDLDEAAKKKKPTVDELIAECEARDLELPRSGSTVKKTGRDKTGTKIGKAYFVGLLRAANGNKRYLKLQSDAAAKATREAVDALFEVPCRAILRQQARK